MMIRLARCRRKVAITQRAVAVHSAITVSSRVAVDSVEFGAGNRGHILETAYAHINQSRLYSIRVAYFDRRITFDARALRRVWLRVARELCRVKSCIFVSQELIKDENLTSVMHLFAVVASVNPLA